MAGECKEGAAGDRVIELGPSLRMARQRTAAVGGARGKVKHDPIELLELNCLHRTVAAAIEASGAFCGVASESGGASLPRSHAAAFISVGRQTRARAKVECVPSHRIEPHDQWGSGALPKQ